MLLNQYWQLQQTITYYCQTNRYPLWRSNVHGFGEQYSDEQIAQWKLGFVAALEKFHSLELFVEYCSADRGDSACVFLSKGEVNAEQSRIIFSALHAGTNDPLGEPPFKKVIRSEIKPCILVELISSNVGIDALINRLEKKYIAPYESEQEVIARLFADSSPQFLLVWSDEQLNPVALLHCKTNTDEFIVLPNAWGRVKDPIGFLGLLRIDENNVFTLFDENRKFRFATLSDIVVDTETGKEFLTAKWFSDTQYIHLEAKQGSCVYEAATELQLTQRGAAFCDLITSKLEQINPQGTKVLVGSWGINSYFLTYADTQLPYRVDVLRWNEQTYQPKNLVQLSPLRWSAIYSESNSLRAVQDPITLLWGFINEIGELVIDTTFVAVGLFYRGLAKASVAEHQWGVINTQGEFVIQPKWKMVDWNSAECISVQYEDSSWSAFRLIAQDKHDYEIAGPVATEQQWLMVYEDYITHRRGGWISVNKTDQEKIVDAITHHYSQRKRYIVEYAKNAESLAELENVFESNACELELSDAGVLRMRVKILRDQPSGIFDIKAGDEGVINTSYPVGLSCFDLRVQAPVTELSQYPDKVIGVAWSDLQCIPSSYKKGLRFSCFDAREGDFLSNGFESTFMLDDMPWKTAEHYYQADVYFGTEYEKVIGCAATAQESRRLAKLPEGKPYRKKRAAHPVYIMLRAVAAKFCLSGNWSLIEKLLNTKNEYLIASFDPHKYWGEGKDGKGKNHLGRILMAIRAVLLSCEHDYLQGISCRPLTTQELKEQPETEAIFELLNKKFVDSTSLFERVVGAANNLLFGGEWDPAYKPPGLHINVLPTPLYGVGIKQLREVFRPWLGVPLAACWGEESFQSPTLVLQAKDSSQAPFKAEFGLCICTQYFMRMGIKAVHCIGVKNADAEWREPAVATLPVPPWQNYLPEFSRKDTGNYWSLESVSVIPTNRQHELCGSTYFQPAAMAIGLEIYARNREGVVLKNIPATFVVLYAESSEGVLPHIYACRNASDILPAPYGKPWQQLTCSEQFGALPLIEKAFAKQFDYWGIELPQTLIVNRQNCESLDDGVDGLTSWSIDVAWGKDEQGEYLDVDSDHRKCGSGYSRIYSDGTISSRSEPIDPEKFKTTPIAEEKSGVENNLSSTPPKPSYWHIRLGGILVALLGLYIAFVMAHGETFPGPVIVFSVVLIVWGAWAAWRPDEWK